MNFWEDFFSLDKMYIPGITAFATGLLTILICSFFHYNPTNFELISMMLISFFVGNILKVNRLEELRRLNNQKSLNNKNRKQKNI